jgi:hypothetical protein
LHFPLAERPKGLNGLTVGLVWNGKHGGNMALKRIAENIERDSGMRFELMEFLDDFPFAQSTIEKISASCQAVVSSTGD